MGREGGYPDLMGCTAKLYAADPVREEFENHPRFKGMDFTLSANPEYYESPYANGALDGWRAKAASQFTAVDMTTAAADRRRSFAEHLVERLAADFPDSETTMTVECFADWLSKGVRP
jgi:hypothetical protein